MTELIEQKIVDLADQYGQPAIDATLAAARTEAASYLASAPLKLGIAGLAAYVAFRLIKAAMESDVSDEIPRWAGGIACIFVAFVTCTMGIWSLIDPWVWVTLFSPEVYIAKRLLP